VPPLAHYQLRLYHFCVFSVKKNRCYQQQQCPVSSCCSNDEVSLLARPFWIRSLFDFGSSKVWSAFSFQLYDSFRRQAVPPAMAPDKRRREMRGVMKVCCTCRQGGYGTPKAHSLILLPYNALSQSNLRMFASSFFLLVASQ
jgi:hypothetical protein